MAIAEDTPLGENEELRRALVAEKHAQAVRLLRDHELDCWLTFSREGSDPLLPYLVGREELVGTAALMLFADGPSVAIVADYDAGQVSGLFDEVHPYALDWREPLRTTLAARRPARIGVNVSEHDHGVDGLTHGLYLALTRALEPLDLIGAVTSAEAVASRVRTIKSLAEVERLRRACRITARIFDDLTAMLRPGLTEADVHGIIGERMATYEVGPAWEAETCPAVFSWATPGGHSAPGQAHIERGQSVRVDFGVVSEGYRSDLQRTWYLLGPGETAPPEAVVREFEAVRDGIALAAELLRPGVRGHEVDGPVRTLLQERGHTFTHALGHQIGRLVHDGGVVLGPDNARYGARAGGVVEAGMVFTLEPCVGRTSIEEDVLVTDDGCEFLVPPQRSPYLV